jgi:uncharacterized membrane protein
MICYALFWRLKMAEIIFLVIIVSTAVAAMWMLYKTEKGIKRLERKTGKSYAEIRSEFYGRPK